MKLNTKTLTEVELGIPIIAEGVYHARMSKQSGKDWVQANKRGDGNNLVIMFRILDPIVMSRKDGKEVQNRGQICLTRWFSLVPNEKFDPDQGMKELAVAIKHDQTQDFGTEALDAFGDGVVMVKVGFQEEQKADPNSNPPKKAYPAGNTVERVTPLPEDDAFTPPPF